MLAIALTVGCGSDDQAVTIRQSHFTMRQVTRCVGDVPRLQQGRNPQATTAYMDGGKPRWIQLPIPLPGGTGYVTVAVWRDHQTAAQAAGNLPVTAPDGRSAAYANVTVTVNPKEIKPRFERRVTDCLK
jgi:hypothetical protein